MVWLILSIISTTGIYVSFKIINNTKTPLVNALIINYLTAAILGFLIIKSFPVKEIINSGWLWLGAIIGILFIVVFFAVGVSSEKAGLSITTVASKMSLIIPMLFSIIVFHEKINPIKVISIILAVISVCLSVFKKNDKSVIAKNQFFLLPFAIFLGMGIGDSLIIYSKEIYINELLIPVFTSTIFLFSFLTGLAYTIIKTSFIRGYLNLNSWIYGIMLGIFNFGSTYFMIKTLNSGIFINSIVYGITNICVIALSAMIGVFFFKEKLSKVNYIGLILSIFTIVLLAYSDF